MNDTNMKTISEYLDIFIRMTVVYVVMFILFVLNISATTSALSAMGEVPFTLMLIYYWSVYRPSLLPSIIVFGLGASFDLLSMMPLGLNALIFLIVRYVITSQRLFLTGQPFIIVWLGFAVVSFAALSMQWAFHGLIVFQWSAIEPIIFTVLISVFIYPPISILLHFLHKILPDIQDQYSAVK